MTETMAFGPLVVRFDERVLRPRPWTLAQSEWAAEVAEELAPGPALELCSGAGHIGLALAARTLRPLVQVDASSVACEFARANAEAAVLSDRVDVRCGPMDAVLAPAERFALVVADPPWVCSDATGEFPDDPLLAIDGGSDGLHVARLCLDVIAGHLQGDGAAILQLGSHDQVESLRSHLGAGAPTGLRVLEVRDPGANGILVRLGRSAVLE